MELYPIFDENTNINSNIWYVITGTGDVPFMRVGHTITHLKANTNENDKGKLYLIGGANPSGCFDEVFTFDLNDLKWTKLNKEQCLNSPRYEHSSFLDNYLNPNFIYIFAGASQENNLNDLNSFDLNAGKWNEVKNCKGSNRPCARTQHVGCVFKNQLVVFGGGKAGSLPVTDQQVHLYNPVNNTWSSPNIKGQAPSNRHGHLMINFNDKCVYLHGGMNDQKFYDDLWLLDFDALMWSRVKQHKSNKPCARAAHGGTCTSKNLYIFGGLDENANALGDFWTYSVAESSWSVVKITGDNPSSRLDYAYCKLKLAYRKPTNGLQEASEASNVDNKIRNDVVEKLVTVFNVEELKEVDETEQAKFVLNNESVKVEDIVEEKTENLNTSRLDSDNKKNIDNNEEKSVITSLDSFKNLTLEANIEEKEYFLIHGGMDCIGNIFDDCFIINLD